MVTRKAAVAEPEAPPTPTPGPAPTGDELEEKIERVVRRVLGPLIDGETLDEPTLAPDEEQPERKTPREREFDMAKAVEAAARGIAGAYKEEAAAPPSGAQPKPETQPGSGKRGRFMWAGYKDEAK